MMQHAPRPPSPSRQKQSLLGKAESESATEAASDHGSPAPAPSSVEKYAALLEHRWITLGKGDILGPRGSEGAQSLKGFQQTGLSAPTTAGTGPGWALDKQ
ncbi:hypothetical protein COCON_G00052170 [Conger conger]|uniref:Uncharacterized protein n=1 Tax=Conger conger TaxID=82655 RepID=A0A9Q1DVV1_CONCO|nr:hypothetical protein COCON_G00052170 [Conger conger]